MLTMAELASRPEFRLGNALVSPSTRTIKGPGGSDLVEPRIMQVLVVLADHLGEVVTREALFERCWGNVYVGDDSLNRAVAGVRRVASGVAGGSFTVETIPRTGYVLTAGGGEATGLPPAAGASPAPAVSARRAITRRWAVAGGVAGAAALLLGGLRLFDSDEPAVSPAAALHARGLDALRYMMPERDAEAVGLLNEAVRVDPANAAAWGTLALAYQRLAERGPPSGSAAATQRAVAAARRSLALDPASADAQAALALLRPSYRDWAAAEARFRTLLARTPDLVAVESALARVMFEVGRIRESVALMARVMQLDPHSASNYWRRMFGLWSNGDLIEAERVIDRGADLFPRNADIWFARFWLLTTSGRAEEGLRLVGEVDGRPLGVPDREFERLILAARAFQSRSRGDVAAMFSAYDEAARQNATGAEVAMLLASTFGALDRAFAIADAYYFDRGFQVPSERLTQGTFSPRNRRSTVFLFWPPAAAMRADPRFLRLTGEIGLEAYWREARVRPDYRTRAT